MMSNHLNIFVSMTPTHISNFERIVSDIGGRNLLLNPGGFNFEKHHWDLVINGSVNLTRKGDTWQGKIIFQFSKIKAYKKYISKMIAETPCAQTYTLYYCNLEDILNNFAFFFFRSQDVKERVLVEDGLLNYYNYKVEEKRTSFFYLKYALCKLYGIPFKLFKGNVTGIQLKEVKKQYVRMPEMAIFSEKAVQLPYDKVHYQPNEKTILFIGQDALANIIGNEKYLRKMDYFLQEIKRVANFNENRFELIYKPHRNGDPKIIEPYGRKYFGRHFTIFLTDTDIEKAVMDIRPAKIFSFSSSGLVNIKLALSNDAKVEFYAYPFASDPKLVSLLKNLKIKILE